jgi:hypothetical protein
LGEKVRQIARAVENRGPEVDGLSRAAERDPPASNHAINRDGSAADRTAGSPTGADSRLRRICVAVVLLGAVILLMHAARYLNFLEDDALIPATYAHRLLAGEGLTWTDGTRVEGYSSMLWVLLLALLGLFQDDLVTAIRVLGVTTSIATIVVLAFWRPRRSASWAAVATGTGIFVLAAPVAIWTVGGLEQPLLGLLLVAATGSLIGAIEGPQGSHTRYVAPGVLFGLVCLVRPDAPLFCLPAGIATLLVPGSARERLNRVALLSVAPVVAVIGQLGFRLLYYGAWLPNTAWVKLSPSGRHLHEGLRYVAGGWASLAPAAIVALVVLVVLVRRSDRRPTACYFLLATTVWTIYLVAIGGGIFPAFRHFVPLVVIIAALVAHAGCEVFGKMMSRRRSVLAGAMLAVLGGWYLYSQLAGAAYLQTVGRSWVWAGRGVALMLRDAFAERPPFIAVTAAGCIPFWTEFPAIDMLGLNDPHIARSRPPNLGSGVIGHEHGDGSYVLSRRPDIIQPCGPWGGLEGCYRAVREMSASGELTRLHFPVTFARPPSWTDPGVHTTVWLRRDSVAVGARTLNGYTYVPGYWLRAGADRPEIAWVSEPGNVSLVVRPGRILTADDIPPPADGSVWTAVLHPPINAEVDLTPYLDEAGRTRLRLRVIARRQALLSAVEIRGETGPDRSPTGADRGEG